MPQKQEAKRHSGYDCRGDFEVSVAACLGSLGPAGAEIRRVQISWAIIGGLCYQKKSSPPISHLIPFQEGEVEYSRAVVNVTCTGSTPGFLWVCMRIHLCTAGRHDVPAGGKLSGGRRAAVSHLGHHKTANQKKIFFLFRLPFKGLNACESTVSSELVQWASELPQLVQWASELFTSPQNRFLADARSSDKAVIHEPK